MDTKELDIFANVDDDFQAEPTAAPTEEPLSPPTVTESPVVEESPVVDPEEPQTVEIAAAEQPEPPKEEVKVVKGHISLNLFKTFFNIGLFTFGGGYAMIPMIESEVVEKKQWIDKEQFLDLIAIEQTCPGVFAINIATFIGYKLRKNRGAFLASLGAALPSFLIILLLAAVIQQFLDVPWVAACFRGIRPAVVALIAVPTFNLARSAKINMMTCWIPILAALLIWILGVNPIFVLLAAGFGGYLYGRLIKQ